MHLQLPSQTRLHQKIQVQVNEGETWLQCPVKRCLEGKRLQQMEHVHSRPLHQAHACMYVPAALHPIHFMLTCVLWPGCLHHTIAVRKRFNKIPQR